MRKGVFLTVIGLFAVTAVITAIVLLNSSGSSNAFAQAKAERGCSFCHYDGSEHGTLAQEVPEGHPKAKKSDIGYCLKCHGAEGPAPVYKTFIHMEHYYYFVEHFPEEVGNCWVCHVLDKEGNFHLYELAG